MLILQGMSMTDHFDTRGADKNTGSVLISRVDHFVNQKLCFDLSLTSIPLKESLTRALSFHYETARYDPRSLTIAVPHFGLSYDVDTLESTPFRGADSLHPSRK